MQSFKLPLSNNATVTGIHCLPTSSAAYSTQYRPLIVALHGGTYDCHYFDGDPKHTASMASHAFGVPFISIDRPCYGGTSSFFPIPKGSDYNQETGSWLHHYILPALWSEFGNGCNCIVLLCHSLGVMGGIVAAALHALDENPTYPLGGIIASGMGDKPSSSARDMQAGAPSMYKQVGPDHVMLLAHLKDGVMFLPGTCTPNILAQTERLNAATPNIEIQEFPRLWLPTWREKWARHVVAPVMFSLVENDPFFLSTKEEVRTCVESFRNSVRVDGSLVKGAPHCMELSYWSQGWYARCFGFAMECSATLSVGRQRWGCGLV